MCSASPATAAPNCRSDRLISSSFDLPLPQSGSRHHTPHRRPDAYRTTFHIQRYQIALEEQLPKLRWESVRFLHDGSPARISCGPETLLTSGRVEEALEVGETEAIISGCGQRIPQFHHIHGRLHGILIPRPPYSVPPEGMEVGGWPPRSLPQESQHCPRPNSRPP